MAALKWVILGVVLALGSCAVVGVVATDSAVGGGVSLATGVLKQLGF